MEKLLGVILGLAIVAGLVWGWVWLLTLIINYVLVAFGSTFVFSKTLTFCCMLLLSAIGSYFKARELRIKVSE